MVAQCLHKTFLHLLFDRNFLQFLELFIFISVVRHSSALNVFLQPRRAKWSRIMCSVPCSVRTRLSRSEKLRSSSTRVHEQGQRKRTMSSSIRAIARMSACPRSTPV
ncbi:hypothetical protein NDU88_004557 [Pleurodeles waltl]|uniref:Secreted protein n=1 Tax=Pleurodeles waltl TaxID=8319 RepID=A0AAV7VIM1_PLEWA|nr:hypothetical protein NDU88_004557 [Pleurodeles waltl]